MTSGEREYFFFRPISLLFWARRPHLHTVITGRKKSGSSDGELYQGSTPSGSSSGSSTDLDACHRRLQHHSIPNLSSSDPFSAHMALVSHPAQIFGVQNGSKSALSQESKPASSKLVNGCIQNGLLNSGLVQSQGASNAILTAAQPFYQSPAVSPQEFQPDRPIGYGAFGVVW